MFLTGTFFNSRNRAEQGDLAYLTHLLEEFFKPVRAAAKKSGKSGGLQNRMKSWPVFIAKAHRFLAVMFRYGLSCGSWSLQL